MAEKHNTEPPVIEVQRRGNANLITLTFQDGSSMQVRALPGSLVIRTEGKMMIKPQTETHVEICQ